VEGKGVPVVLVHGLSADLGLNWVRPGVFHALAKRYRVVALDLRGHGRSGKPHDPARYGTEMVGDIVRLMDHLQIGKAHVVGYSMGGFIALKMAAMHPDRMLSVAPCGSGWSADPDRDLAFMKTLADSIDRGEGYGPLLERLQPVGQPVSPRRIRFVSALMSWRNDPQAMAALLRSVDALRVDEAALRGNALPAIALVGARDPLKPLADQMCAVMANIREVSVPGANHFSTLSKPETLLALEEFLEANSPAPEAAKAETMPVRQLQTKDAA
jgi:pimeloyl-ACP methyl ester carboxylesterase